MDFDYYEGKREDPKKISVDTSSSDVAAGAWMDDPDYNKIYKKTYGIDPPSALDSDWRDKQDGHKPDESECQHCGGFWSHRLGCISLLANGSKHKTTEEVIVPVAIREAVLQAAITAVTGDRNNTYGDPWDDFKRTSDALTAMGYRHSNEKTGVFEALRPHDIAVIQVMVKLSRLTHTPVKRDSWVDVAGYAACGAEVAELE